MVYFSCGKVCFTKYNSLYLQRDYYINRRVNNNYGIKHKWKELF